MFSKQSGNSELFPGLCLLLVWTFWQESVTFGRGTGKSMSEALIFASINPKYSIPLLGRFTLIIHQISISRTSTVLKCKYTCLTPSEVHGTVKLKGLARTQIPTNRNDDAEFPTFGEIAGVNHSLVQWSSLALEEPPSWSWLRPLVQVSMPNPSFFKISRTWFS